MDHNALAQLMAGIVKQYVSEALDPLVQRIKAVESVDAADTEQGLIALAINELKAKHTENLALCEGLEAKVDELESGIADIATRPDPVPGIIETVLLQAKQHISEVTAEVKGEPGPPGTDGKPGPAGKDADPLDMHAVGQLVTAAVADAVKQLEIPAGEPGRDALELEIMPEIDLAKSYPRGKYARHAGGLWRSFEATKELRGWECIVEGIAALSIDYDQERSVSLSVKTSSGETVAKELTLPLMIYRGVHSEGTKAMKGDVFTFGGSAWVCLADTESKPGGGAKEWRLAVKAGRDASAPVKLGGKA